MSVKCSSFPLTSLMCRVRVVPNKPTVLTELEISGPGLDQRLTFDPPRALSTVLSQGMACTVSGVIADLDSQKTDLDLAPSYDHNPTRFPWVIDVRPEPTRTDSTQEMCLRLTLVVGAGQSGAALASDLVDEVLMLAGPQLPTEAGATDMLEGGAAPESAEDIVKRLRLIEEHAAQLEEQATQLRSYLAICDRTRNAASARRTSGPLALSSAVMRPATRHIL